MPNRTLTTRFRLHTRQLLKPVMTVIFATFAATVAIHVAPGSSRTLAAGDSNLGAVAEAAWRHKFGLDRPLFYQYVSYASHALRGDLGESFVYVGQSVTDLLRPALLTTVLWEVPAIVFSVGVALLLATSSVAYGHISLPRILSSAMVLGFSTPEFIVALPLVMIFSVALRVLPVAGNATLDSYILPILTLSISIVASLSHILIADLKEIMAEDFIRTARAKGLSSLHIVWRHALPNAVGPFIQNVSYQVGKCIGGAFVIETIFNVPGVGRLAVSSVLQRDYPVVLAVTLVISMGFAFSTLLFDLGAAVFNVAGSSEALGHNPVKQ